MSRWNAIVGIRDSRHRHHDHFRARVGDVVLRTQCSLKNAEQCHVTIAVVRDLTDLSVEGALKGI